VALPGTARADVLPPHEHQIAADDLRRPDHRREDIALVGSLWTFAGTDASGNYGLWATDGTILGSSEILAGTQGAYNLSPGNNTVFGGKDPTASLINLAAAGFAPSSEGAGSLSLTDATSARFDQPPQLSANPSHVF
jgi:hypothetical protein